MRWFNNSKKHTKVVENASAFGGKQSLKEDLIHFAPPSEMRMVCKILLAVLIFF